MTVTYLLILTPDQAETILNEVNRTYLGVAEEGLEKLSRLDEARAVKFESRAIVATAEQAPEVSDELNKLAEKLRDNHAA